MDLESLKQEPQPWEFRTHPAWQRLLVMCGGVLFNFISAILFFTCILGIRGESYIQNEGNAVYVNDLAYEMGFRTGDRILRYDDYVPQDFYALQADLARRDVHKATILRGTDTVEIYIDRARIGDVLSSPGMFDLAFPFVVDSIPPESPNLLTGLRRGDKVLAVDSVLTLYAQDAKARLAERASQRAVLTLERDGAETRVPVSVDSLGRIGVYMMLPGVQTRRYNALTVLPAGVRYTYTTIRDYLRDLRLVATPSTQAYKSVGSFIAIGQVFPSRWDWIRFLYLLGLLSVMLGVMNLLPIPGLDGGHILFTVYEMLTGRKPGDKFLSVAQMIGMVLLLLLMLLAFGNDIGRLIK